MENADRGLGDLDVRLTYTQEEQEKKEENNHNIPKQVVVEMKTRKKERGYGQLKFLQTIHFPPKKKSGPNGNGGTKVFPFRPIVICGNIGKAKKGKGYGRGGF